MKEQNHQKHGSIVKRQRETDVRATCGKYHFQSITFNLVDLIHADLIPPGV